jgi:hypothetical protein
MHTLVYALLSLLPALALAASSHEGFAHKVKRQTPPGTHIVDLHRRGMGIGAFAGANGVFNPSFAKVRSALLICVTLLTLLRSSTMHAPTSTLVASMPECRS